MKTNYNNTIPNDFFNNVLKISTSTIISALVVAIALPIITKIFSASILGKYQLLISIITIFGVISCFKYEMAIVLPEKDNIASNVLILCLLALSSFCLILFFIFYLTNGVLLKALNAENLIDAFWLIPIGVLFFGLFEIIKYSLLRKKLFNHFSKARVYQVLSTQSLMIIFGLIKPSFISLFLAFISGHFISTMAFLKKSLMKIKPSKNIQIFKVAKKFKKFPFFNTPMVFANTLSNELPVFFLATYFSSETLGYFLLANRLIVIPMNLIGTAINKVYFQKASETFNRNKNDLFELYISTTKKLILLGIPPLFVFYFLSDFIIDLIFGDNWVVTGQMMKIIAVTAFFKFITSPIGTSFTIINKQDFAFYLTFLSLVLRFFIMLNFHNSISSLFWAFTISSAIYYIVYHIFVFRLLSEISKDNE
jgi:O-antigen/teichoic acid export membrane protein